MTHTCNDPRCPNSSGICRCGCGQKTNILTYTQKDGGALRGHPARFVRSHNVRTVEHKAKLRQGQLASEKWLNKKPPSGDKSPLWKGGRFKNNGYMWIKKPEHPRADSHGYILEHIVIAEKSLGRSLLPNEIVHHKDEDGTNNSPRNLKVMTRSDHNCLHRRKKDIWIRCHTCYVRIRVTHSQRDRKKYCSMFCMYNRNS